MPSNNSNSTSALSRQMQRLRRQVDQIDLKILQLLQQRTKLSGRIGQAKQRYHAAVYVPERERELLAKITRRSRGGLPARAVTSIYREILSSSRAAQGQAPIGLLRESAAVVIPPGRWCFGACDEFLPCKSWTEVADGLETGSLAAALLTGAELARALNKPKERKQFLSRLTVVGDLAPALEMTIPLARRIFIVTPRGTGAAGEANRALILIECKSMANAVKSLFNSMPDRPIHIEPLSLGASAPAPRASASAVALVTFLPMLDGIRVTSGLVTTSKALGIDAAILGVYPGTETYGG